MKTTCIHTHYICIYTHTYGESTHAREPTRRATLWRERLLNTHARHVYTHKFICRKHANSRVGRRETRFGENRFYVYTRNIYTHTHVRTYGENTCARELTSRATWDTFWRERLLRIGLWARERRSESIVWLKRRWWGGECICECVCVCVCVCVCMWVFVCLSDVAVGRRETRFGEKDFYWLAWKTIWIHSVAEATTLSECVSVCASVCECVAVGWRATRRPGRERKQFFISRPKYRSLLQKSPIKETIHCKRDLWF